MPRTTTDFSQHELKITASENLSIHDLRMADSPLFRVRFINTCGHLIVDGDYGTWVFCREFMPSKEGYVSSMYWVEKLQADSTQQAKVFDNNQAVKQVTALTISANENGCSEGTDIWLDELMYAAELSEYEYIAVIMDYPPDIDSEDLPDGKIVNPRLNIIFDAFEEVCRRMI